MSSDGAVIEGQPQQPAPDATLAALYKSARPPVELIPGVSLSPIINSTWLPSDAKAMLSESWIPAPPEESDTPSPPAPSFDPAAAEYKEMAKRLSKSAALVKYNELTIRIKQLETDLEGLKDEKVKEEKNAELEQCRATMAEVEGQLAELKASFQEDPLSLVPWIQSLFDLADAGMTTLDVSGPFYPFTNLRALLSNDNTASVYDGVEKVLGVFKRRYEKERGPGKIQILTKLVPNIFQDGYAAQAYVEGVIDKIRANTFGAEATDALDLVQLYWWDAEGHDFLPTLKALQKLSEDKLEVAEDSGEVTITEPKKIKALGLVDFPWRAIISAMQAGVPVVSIQIPFSIADRSHAKALAVAQEYNIKVFARDGTLGGLVSEKYIGAPALETTTSDLDIDDVPYAVELVNNYGGWDKFQKLLSVVKAIADKHQVKMQSVVIRWQIDHGTFPMATTKWARSSWNQFGYHYWTGTTPGLDWQVFQVESFLDAGDMKQLNMLAM